MMKETLTANESPECASHDDLVRACRLLVQAYGPGEEDQSGHVDWYEMDQAYKIARNALAKILPPSTELEVTEKTATQKVATLNDQCRKAPGILCRVMLTEGICALPPTDQLAIIEKVETFDVFTEDNDPYHEHDFGAFEQNGEKVFWKIDYYDPTMTWHSEDKADPAKTVRVLTIMLASEY